MRLLLLFSLAWVGCSCNGNKPKTESKKSATRLALAIDFVKREEYDAAEREGQKAIAFNPKNEEAHYVLGLVDFLRARKNQLSLEVQSCLTGLDAEALRAEITKNFTSAQVHFEKATKLASDYGDAWAMQGVVATHMEDYDKAVKYLREALATPARVTNIGLTRAHLGWAYFHAHKHVEAATALRQALQFHPKMCVASYRLGRVYFARKEWDKAMERFREVVGDKSCRSQEAHVFLMKSYLAKKQYSQLETLRDSCLTLSPRSCLAAQCRSLARTR